MMFNKIITVSSCTFEIAGVWIASCDTEENNDGYIEEYTVYHEGCDITDLLNMAALEEIDDKIIEEMKNE